jgi:hypothetical protein
MATRQEKLKKKIKAKRGIVDDIMDYEMGELSNAKTIKMFQKMVNDGSAWKLQGSYGRTAMSLLDAGYIKAPKKKAKKNNKDNYGNQIWG